MLEQVANAIKRQDYRTAAQLLKQLMHTESQNPWVQFYVGHLHEATGKPQDAEKAYRQLLRSATNPKIIAQARQGIERLEALKQEKHQHASAQAMAALGSEELSVLVLEPIPSELKQAAAQRFARIMQLDPYSARLKLPSRGWRLYRVGAVGELQFYTTALMQAEIPCFCTAVSEIGKLNVFQTNYFQSIAPKTTVICQNPQGQRGKLTFNWSEISQRVEGLVPLFEAVLDIDVQHKLQRKTKTLDYVQFCDLHLPARKTILRLCDRHYEFQQGISFSQEPKNPQHIEQTTTRSNWNNLINFLNQQLPQSPVWSDFTTFAETALDFSEMLRRIEPHIDLFRREETLWDAAFQLYSSLVFLRSR